MTTYTTSSTTSYDATWTIWTTDTTAATSTVWYGWCDSGTSTTTDSTGSIWYRWVDSAPQIIITQQRQPSEAEIAENKRIEREQLEAFRAKEAAKKEKARELLREVLTDEQDKQFDEKGYFELVSVKSGKRYRVHKGRTRNVELLKADGTVAKRLCFHPEEYVHDYDTLVSQKLMLENYEDEVKKVANYS